MTGIGHGLAIIAASVILMPMAPHKSNTWVSLAGASVASFANATAQACAPTRVVQSAAPKFAAGDRAFIRVDEKPLLSIGSEGRIRSLSAPSRNRCAARVGKDYVLGKQLDADDVEHVQLHCINVGGK